MRPRLALTSGEPSGIGPDLCLQLASRNLDFDVIVLGDLELLAERSRLLGLEVSLVPWSPGEATEVPSGSLRVWSVATAINHAPGVLDPQNADYVLALIDRAVGAVQAGSLDALVTAPISKASINAAGIPFTGHTEYLEALTGGQSVMVLTAPGLRVALATTHLALREVPDALTAPRLERILEVLFKELESRLGIERPRILVAGLNPHAGEAGHLGHEEITVIEPVLARFRSRGHRLEGPLPADTLFVPHRLEGADAVLAMYHDQGLPVLKFMGFGQAVNLTLGLPIIRTSVDHGTALDLAGRGGADAGSLFAALEAASQMVRHARNASIMSGRKTA